MCLDKKCGSIDIIEIYDNIKVFLHYERDSDPNNPRKPFFIQYRDETRPAPIKPIERHFSISKKKTLKIKLKPNNKTRKKYLADFGEKKILL
jgi:hypothetical protein